MEFQNAQHKQLHELLLKLGYELADSTLWEYAYSHKCHHGESVSFDYVEDYSIFSGMSKLIRNLNDLPVVGVLATLRTRLLPNNDNIPTIKIAVNKYTPDEVAFLDAAALVLIQVEYQGKHLTYAEAYAEAVNMLKARRECLGGEHD